MFGNWRRFLKVNEYLLYDRLKIYKCKLLNAYPDIRKSRDKNRCTFILYCFHNDDLCLQILSQGVISVVITFYVFYASKFNKILQLYEFH